MNACPADRALEEPVRRAYLAIVLGALLTNVLGPAPTTAVAAAHVPAPGGTASSVRGRLEPGHLGVSGRTMAPAAAHPSAGKAVPALRPPAQQQRAAATPVMPLARPLAAANGALAPLAGNIQRASLRGTGAAAAWGGAQHRAPVNASLGGPAIFDARKLTRR